MGPLTSATEMVQSKNTFVLLLDKLVFPAETSLDRSRTELTIKKVIL